jgi:hypothetical protein
LADSSATRQRADEIRLFIKETADKLTPVAKTAIPRWLIVVLAIFPMGVTLLTVGGAAFVGSYRLSQNEAVLADMADTMKRVEGALSHMEVLEQRIVWLEKDAITQERDIRMIESIARDNKTAVRNVAHDVSTFRTFLPIAAKGDG